MRRPRLANFCALRVQRNRLIEFAAIFVPAGKAEQRNSFLLLSGSVPKMFENGGAKVGHGSGGMSLLRAV